MLAVRIDSRLQRLGTGLDYQSSAIVECFRAESVCINARPGASHRVVFQRRGGLHDSIDARLGPNRFIVGITDTRHRQRRVGKFAIRVYPKIVGSGPVSVKVMADPSIRLLCRDDICEIPFVAVFQFRHSDRVGTILLGSDADRLPGDRIGIKERLVSIYIGDVLYISSHREGELRVQFGLAVIEVPCRIPVGVCIGDQLA